jgi:hypothetical protein
MQRLGSSYKIGAVVEKIEKTGEDETPYIRIIVRSRHPFVKVAKFLFTEWNCIGVLAAPNMELVFEFLAAWAKWGVPFLLMHHIVPKGSKVGGMYGEPKASLRG